MSDCEEVKWCYQIIDHGTKEQPYCSVHEVYFDVKTKKIVAYTENPITMQHYESKEELIEVLEMIIDDLRKNKVLTSSEVDRDVYTK